MRVSGRHELSRGPPRSTPCGGAPASTGALSTPGRETRSLIVRGGGLGEQPRTLKGPRQCLHQPREAITRGCPSGLVVGVGDQIETRLEFERDSDYLFRCPRVAAVTRQLKFSSEWFYIPVGGTITHTRGTLEGMSSCDATRHPQRCTVICGDAASVSTTPTLKNPQYRFYRTTRASASPHATPLRSKSHLGGYF